MASKKSQKKGRAAPVTPTVFTDLLEMPGTRVLFWAVGECPYCGSKHYHPAGVLSATLLAGRAETDPADRLGETQAPCGNGPYILALPPRPLRKKGKRARRSDWAGTDLEDE